MGMFGGGRLLAPRRPAVYDTSAALPPVPAARLAQIEGVLSSIRARDPGFDSAALLRAAQAEFVLVKAERAQHRVDRVRSHCLPACFEHWLAQDREQQQIDAVQEFHLVAMDDCAVVAAAEADGSVLLLVGFAFRAVVFTVHLPTNALLFGSLRARPFTEFWVLSRPAAARTGPVTACGGCGAPPAAGRDECQACGEILSELGSWVIAAAGEEPEWRLFPA